MRDYNYIHYGIDKTEYDPMRVVQEKKNHLHSKPSRGLWASPLREGAYTWKEWCESEEFHTERLSTSFKFSIKDTAKILEVHSEDDILPYLVKDPNDHGYLRFGKTSMMDSLNEEVLFEKFDGIELFISDDYPTLHYGFFNSWDVDSVVVWNPDVIDILD